MRQRRRALALILALGLGSPSLNLSASAQSLISAAAISISAESEIASALYTASATQEASERSADARIRSLRTQIDGLRRPGSRHPAQHRARPPRRRALNLPRPKNGSLPSLRPATGPMLRRSRYSGQRWSARRRPLKALLPLNSITKANVSKRGKFSLNSSAQLMKLAAPGLRYETISRQLSVFATLLRLKLTCATAAS